jgi:hypothetical protein
MHDFDLPDPASASARPVCPQCDKPLRAFGASVLVQAGLSTVCFVHADGTRCGRTEATDRRS